MGERTADGAAVADLEVAHEGRRPGQQGDRFRHQRIGLGAGVDGAGADAHGAAAALDPPQLLDPAHVDEVVEVGQAEGEHGHQALAAGQHPGAVTELGQQGHGLGGRRRPVVLERRRLHVPPPGHTSAVRLHSRVGGLSTIGPDEGQRHRARLIAT